MVPRKPDVYSAKNSAIILSDKISS